MRSPLFICLTLLPLLGLRAAHYHVSPEGAGTMDGMVWAHAFPASEIDRIVNELMKPGDHLQFAPGVYEGIKIHLKNSGEPGNPITLSGIDQGQGLPVLTTQWNERQPDNGHVVIEIADGVSHVVLEKLRIKGAVIGIRTQRPSTGRAREGLVFRDVDVSHCREGYVLSDCKDLLLERCDVKRYSMHGFRLEGGCTEVVFRNCTADCSEGDSEWEDKTEHQPSGFFVNDKGAPSVRIHFERCLARNNMMLLQTNLDKNGEGFVVEAGAAEISFDRCRAIRNQDGGFHVKAKDPLFTNCIGVGNARAFRLWNGGTLSNSIATRANVGLWSNGGPVTVERSTFHQMAETAVKVDSAASGPVSLANCLISECNTPHKSTRPGMIVLKDTLNSSDPHYARPSADWDGTGDAMDSLSHPDHGYKNPDASPRLKKP